MEKSLDFFTYKTIFRGRVARNWIRSKSKPLMSLPERRLKWRWVRI